MPNRIRKGDGGMERLTEWTEGGVAIQRMDLRRNGNDRCTKKLAEYEDLGMEPWEIKPYIELAEKMNLCDLVRENKKLSDKIRFLEAQKQTG